VSDGYSDAAIQFILNLRRSRGAYRPPDVKAKIEVRADLAMDLRLDDLSASDPDSADAMRAMLAIARREELAARAHPHPLMGPSHRLVVQLSDQIFAAVQLMSRRARDLGLLDNPLLNVDRLPRPTVGTAPVGVLGTLSRYESQERLNTSSSSMIACSSC
jgi:hypothetical protein